MRHLLIVQLRYLINLEERAKIYFSDPFPVTLLQLAENEFVFYWCSNISCRAKNKCSFKTEVSYAARILWMSVIESVLHKHLWNYFYNCELRERLNYPLGRKTILQFLSVFLFIYCKNPVLYIEGQDSRRNMKYFMGKF